MADQPSPVFLLSSADGSYSEYLLADETGGYTFAEADTTLGPGGIDPQDVEKLIGEKTGIIEATYGDFEAGDFEDDMRGKEGLTLFMKMLGDSSIEQGLARRRDARTNTRWRIVPGGDDQESLEQAAFVADQLGINDMKAGKTSIEQLYAIHHVSEVLRRGYGELCFAPGPDGKMVLDKIKPMHPLTIEKTEYDNKGGLKGVVQKGKIRGEKGKQVEKKVPIFKMVIFTNNDDGISEGESILRPAIVHWRIKRALMVLMNQGTERHALGVPVVSPPAEITPKTKQWAAARKMAIDFVTRPRTGILLPKGWEFKTVELNGQMPDIMNYIEYHDRCIMRALGVEDSSVGLKEGQVAPSNAGKVSNDSIRAMLIRFASAINLYVIPKMIVLNWPNATRYPRLVPELDNSEDLSAAANLYGMVMNAAIDMVVAQTQVRVQLSQINTDNTSRNPDKAAAAGAGGKAGAVAGGASRTGSGKTPTKKFSGLDDGSLEFAEGEKAGADGIAKLASSDLGVLDPEKNAENVRLVTVALMEAMPTKLQRLLGYLEDKQAKALDPLRQSAQTVRKVDRRKPV